MSLLCVTAMYGKMLLLAARIINADGSILLQILLLMNRSMLLMNRISERCHRDLKYSNAVDEDAPSNAAVNTAAKNTAKNTAKNAAKSVANECCEECC